MKSTKLFFDIESGPQPDAYLSTVLPAFNPEDVKLGNIKDPEKIAAKIEEARCNHFTNFKANAALDAKYGKEIGRAHV